MAQGIVKFFRPEKGWGAITSPELPDGRDAFAHYTAIEGEGFRMLSEGSASSSTTSRGGRTASSTLQRVCVSSDRRRTDGRFRPSVRASS